MMQKFVVHLIAWVIFFFYELLIKGQVIEYPERIYRELGMVSIRVACLAMLVYFVLYFLFEKLYIKGFKKSFFLSLVLAILLCNYLMRGVSYFFYWKPEGNYSSLIELYSNHLKTVVYFGNIVFVLGMAALFYFVSKWNEQEKKQKELERHQKEAQLEQLKSQIQPHFLFNTLNNIHALAEKQSHLTSKAIFRLSGLLEYSLYDSKKLWNSLQSELDYLEHYIELEKMRYGERLKVVVNVFCDPQKHQIPSFTLLPYAENAFKHGLSQHTKEGFLSIEINESNQRLIIKIENSIDEKSAQQLTNKRGIGMKNVAERLKILYADQHTIQISETNDIYRVVLKLPYKYVN